MTTNRQLTIHGIPGRPPPTDVRPRSLHSNTMKKDLYEVAFTGRKRVRVGNGIHVKLHGLIRIAARSDQIEISGDV